jgi:hypothetical protein
MVKAKEVGDFIGHWKKSFIGGTITVLAMVVGIATGVIKIWEKAEELMENQRVEVQQSRVPIHDHVTFEINKLTRRLEMEGVVSSNRGITDSSYLERYKGNLAKQKPSSVPQKK